MSQPPSRFVSSTRLHNLPPGCKVLSCHEAHNVLRSSSTIRLPDGSVVAPLGGELYQVVELPSSCDERCSLRETVSLLFVLVHLSCSSCFSLHYFEKEKNNIRNYKTDIIFMLLVNKIVNFFKVEQANGSDNKLNKLA